MPGRIRRAGAGRKNMVEHDPKLLVSLDRLIEPETRGDPESPLRWICKSTRKPIGGIRLERTLPMVLDAGTERVRNEQAARPAVV
jgi:hypothetical protein